ncbi:MAG: hypothetical protein GXO76_09205 [Calditrichaeota bacterium]|nr:hypothetical protein [Calditrichota bacterium]
MKKNKIKYYIKGQIFLFILFLSIARPIAAKTYFIDPNGSNQNPGTESLPLATFEYAMNVLQPGDVLLLKDGVYRQTLNVTLSGKENAPIAFRAQNDGKAVVDGEYVRSVLTIVDQHDITIGGIVFKNSNGSVIRVTRSSRVILRRVSAYNAGSGNYHVFDIWLDHDILLEDCAASGSGRMMYDVLNSRDITLRRCWGRWQSHSGGGGDNGIIEIYGTNNSLVENCIGTKDTHASVNVQGIGVWANWYNERADSNRFFGNITFNLSSWSFFNTSAQHRTIANQFIDNASIQSPYGYIQRGDANCTVRQMTIVGAQKIAFSLDPNSLPLDSDYFIKSDVRNSVFIDAGIGFSVNNRFPSRISLFEKYNDLFRVDRPYSGFSPANSHDIQQDPEFLVNRYGKGGYLFVPDSSPVKNLGEAGTRIGAKILYRYENGSLSTIPLWPWPMEERILNETGQSVTYESKGGLWKTLDGLYTETQSPFDFSISSESEIDLPVRGEADANISIKLISGSSSPVTLSAEKLPRGVTVQFQREPYTPTCEAKAIFKADSTAIPGNYYVSLWADGKTVQHSVNLRLVITKPLTNELTSFHVISAITVDGFLREKAWNYADSVIFNNPQKSDNQVTAFSLWNDQNLYFAFRVKDNQLEVSNSALWLDDGIEIYLDTQNNRSTSLDSDDYHFIVTINKISNISGIPIGFHQSEQGYVLEIAIPWSLINTVPAANQTMGFLLGNNDRDNEKTVQFDWLNLIQLGSYAHPNLWGTLFLSNKPVGSVDDKPPQQPSGIRVRPGGN